MTRHDVAPGVLRIALLPFDAVNVYVLDNVLVDSGGRGAASRLLDQLSSLEIRGHALTHAHPDHQGSSHVICERLGIPLWCGAGDRKAMESGDQSSLFAHPGGFGSRMASSLAGASHAVERTLAEGDSVGSFEAIETPGHTPGHLSYWRERDRLLIAGDVLFNRNPVNLRAGLQEAFAFATADRQASRRSIHRIAALRPSIVCFGHGAPLTDLRSLEEFARTIPE